MDKCNPEVSAKLVFKMRNAARDEQMNRLREDVTYSCNQYGAFIVYKALIRQMDAIKKEDANSDFVTNLDLAVHKTDYSDLMDMSNIAFWLMTNKEQHYVFCEKFKMEFWWPVGTGPTNDL